MAALWLHGQSEMLNTMCRLVAPNECGRLKLAFLGLRVVGGSKRWETGGSLASQNSPIRVGWSFLADRAETPLRESDK